MFKPWIPGQARDDRESSYPPPIVF